MGVQQQNRRDKFPNSAKIMGPPKSKSNVGLGRTLINDRHKAVQNSRAEARGGRTAQHTTETHHEPNWVKLRSITQERALDEFLSTAELAGTEFTAERKNLKIITSDAGTNPYLLTQQQETELLKKQTQKKSALKVPRRPAWTESTTPSQLELAEKEAFLEWRRGLAHLQESDDLLLTPFERNLEVWRQLWRVIERSDLVVQIVDGRNPLLFRTEDLEKYVLEVDKEKRNLLLVNKADLMTEKQRKMWADWFTEQGIRFAFYSARLAKEAQEKSLQEEEDEDEAQESGEDEGDEETGELAEEVDDSSINRDSPGNTRETKNSEADRNPSRTGPPKSQEKSDSTSLDPRIQILTVHELQALFLREAPTPKGHDPLHPEKLVVGLVGYPNVGKSSTINSLLGEKRVSVSSTPGKTKHFQTIHLPPQERPDIPGESDTQEDSDKGVILCDCPGLVFPNFASTKAELVCNGILPIDQLREWTGPGELIARRIPKEVLEQVYTFKMYHKSESGEEVTGEELLVSFALARGYTKAGPVGNPDDARAARILLKDFVNGKILYCHPPPGITPKEFNEGHYTTGLIVHKELNPFAPAMPDEQSEIDQGFFKDEDPRARTRNGVFGGRNMQYDFQKRVGDDGRILSGQEKQMRQEMGGKAGKKHFKGRGK